MSPAVCGRRAPESFEKIQPALRRVVMKHPTFPASGLQHPLVVVNNAQVPDFLLALAAHKLANFVREEARREAAKKAAFASLRKKEAMQAAVSRALWMKLTRHVMLQCILYALQIFTEYILRM